MISCCAAMHCCGGLAGGTSGGARQVQPPNNAPACPPVPTCRRGGAAKAGGGAGAAAAGRRRLGAAGSAGGEPDGAAAAAGSGRTAAAAAAAGWRVAASMLLRASPECLCKTVAKSPLMRGLPNKCVKSVHQQRWGGGVHSSLSAVGTGNGRGGNREGSRRRLLLSNQRAPARACTINLPSSAPTAAAPWQLLVRSPLHCSCETSRLTLSSVRFRTATSRSLPAAREGEEESRTGGRHSDQSSDGLPLTVLPSLCLPAPQAAAAAPRRACCRERGGRAASSDSLLVSMTSPRMATPASKRTRPWTVSEVQWKREGTEGQSASSWSTSLRGEGERGRESVVWRGKAVR